MGWSKDTTIVQKRVTGLCLILWLWMVSPRSWIDHHTQSLCHADIHFSLHRRSDRLFSPVSICLYIWISTKILESHNLFLFCYRSEKYVYDSIYKDIKGLKNYFPSLGWVGYHLCIIFWSNLTHDFLSNHDIEHMGGAKFGGDQWNGPPNWWVGYHHCII